MGIVSWSLIHCNRSIELVPRYSVKFYITPRYHVMQSWWIIEANALAFTLLGLWCEKMLISNSTFPLLTILEDIKFVVKPTSKDNITKGSSFSLSCGVKSSRQVKYKWQFNGQDLKYDDNYIWYEGENRLLIKNANVSFKGCLVIGGDCHIIVLTGC